MNIKPGFLIIKGNFTQRQFDAINRIWNDLMNGNEDASVRSVISALPAIQLADNGDIEIIQLHEDGFFRSSKCRCKCDE
jgi:hypothetical protein